MVKRRRTRRHILGTAKNNKSRITSRNDFQEKQTRIIYSNVTIIDPEEILVIPRAIHELEHVNCHSNSRSRNQRRTEFISFNDANNERQQQGCYVILQYLTLWILTFLYYDITAELSASKYKYI